MSFSLYVHIPYCQSKCPYCDFNSYAASAWPESDYVGALAAELARRIEHPPWAGKPIKTIFFGGGTPSLFRPESIAAVIETARRLCGVERDAEITLEANPGTVDLAKLRGFREAGVNRISFGAQSFNPAILKFLGRIHTANQTRAAVEMAHQAGFARLNLDLIFAVPGQTLEDVRGDMDNAVSLSPDHISAYNLTFEEGTTFFTDMKRGRITPLGDGEQAQMYALIRQELPARGYGMYEISNYAKPGREARHNLTYWRAESYLGLGAGAHSFAREAKGEARVAAAGGGGMRFPSQGSGQALAPLGMTSEESRWTLVIPSGARNLARASAPSTLRASASSGEYYGRRWWNERNPARYVAIASRDGLAEAGSEPIDSRAAAGEFVFLNLRLREGFSLTDFSARFGVEFGDVFPAQVSELLDSRLLLRENDRVRLSDRGLELADSVFAEFV